MKLILAIVSDEDSAKVTGALSENGFYATKLATTGGFLKSGNVTMLIGVEDSLVENVIDIIRSKSKKRKKYTSTAVSAGEPSQYPMEVEVGGGTVFVLNIDKFEKV